MIVIAADRFVDLLRPRVKIVVLAFFTYVALC